MTNKPAVFNYQEYEKAQEEIRRLRNQLTNMEIKYRIATEKTGEWIPQSPPSNLKGTLTVYVFPKCSECGHSGKPDYNFCPNCGAKMGGDDNE